MEGELTPESRKAEGLALPPHTLPSSVPIGTSQANLPLPAPALCLLGSHSDLKGPKYEALRGFSL